MIIAQKTEQQRNVGTAAKKKDRKLNAAKGRTMEETLTFWDTLNVQQQQNQKKQAETETTEQQEIPQAQRNTMIFSMTATAHMPEILTEQKAAGCHKQDHHQVHSTKQTRNSTRCEKTQQTQNAAIIARSSTLPQQKPSRCSKQ